MEQCRLDTGDAGAPAQVIGQRIATARMRQVLREALQLATRHEVDMQRGAAAGFDAIAQRRRKRINQMALDTVRRDEKLAFLPCH